MILHTVVPSITSRSQFKRLEIAGESSYIHSEKLWAASSEANVFGPAEFHRPWLHSGPPEPQAWLPHRDSYFKCASKLFTFPQVSPQPENLTE